MHKRFFIGKEGLGLFFLSVVWLRFFWPMLFEGQMLFDRDFSHGTYPIRFYLYQAYHQGFIPHWIQNLYSGAPFFAELHPGVFYPPSVLFFLNSFPLALNLFYLFHFFARDVLDLFPGAKLENHRYRGFGFRPDSHLQRLPCFDHFSE